MNRQGKIIAFAILRNGYLKDVSFPEFEEDIYLNKLDDTLKVRYPELISYRIQDRSIDLIDNQWVIFYYFAVTRNLIDEPEEPVEVEAGNIISFVL